MNKTALTYSCCRCSYTCKSDDDGVQGLKTHVVDVHGYDEWHTYLDRDEFLDEVNASTYTKICVFS